MFLIVAFDGDTTRIAEWCLAIAFIGSKNALAIRPVVMVAQNDSKMNLLEVFLAKFVRVFDFMCTCWQSVTVEERFYGIVNA